MATKKDRLGDGKINTGIEMIEDQEENYGSKIQWKHYDMRRLKQEKN